MLKKDISSSDMTMMAIASVVITLPFIFYAKDMANSLRSIAKILEQPDVPNN